MYFCKFILFVRINIIYEYFKYKYKFRKFVWTNKFVNFVYIREVKFKLDSIKNSQVHSLGDTFGINFI